MHTPAALIFLGVGCFVHLLLRTRRLTNRFFYRYAVGALVSTGIGFLIPVVIYFDILALFALFVGYDAYRQYRQRQSR